MNQESYYLFWKEISISPSPYSIYYLLSPALISLGKVLLWFYPH